jgi:NAD(P)-dependent dehydrogenase (short-subunit alcohol dehydrogenase family)
MSELRKKVLVSGASSGIGQATAVRFAGEGWDVCLNARREGKLLEIAGRLPAGDHLVCAGDYSDPHVVEAIGRAIRDRWGVLDVLVNSAGVSLGGEAIASPLEEWRRPFDMMVNGAVGLTRAAVPLMTRGGRIVHITSIHGERGERLASAYGMAKAAVNQYCRVLAIELAPRGILVNAIAPGFVDTPMSVKEWGNELQSAWFRENYVEGHHLPLRRAAQPEEIAGVAWFLAGPDASYITGQVLTVDGGLTITF